MNLQHTENGLNQGSIYLGVITVTPERKRLALVGTGIAHALAPTIHNHVAQSINLPWTFGLADAPSISTFIKGFRDPSWVGAVITLPYKRTVIPLLDDTDEHVKALKACNGIWKTKDGCLVGTNTDWIDIYGSLVAATEERRGKPALIIGAGGASRAAVYALSKHLDYSSIYVVNRDEQEVTDLIEDVTDGYRSTQLSVPHIVHVTSTDLASTLQTPYYIVRTVPDFSPQTPSEIVVQEVLLHFLRRPEKGVLLDMCYKPRETRHLKLAKREGWRDVGGINIIAWQIETQWKLWAGKQKRRRYGCMKRGNSYTRQPARLVLFHWLEISWNWLSTQGIRLRY